MDCHQVVRLADRSGAPQPPTPKISDVRSRECCLPPVTRAGAVKRKRWWRDGEGNRVNSTFRVPRFRRRRRAAATGPSVGSPPAPGSPDSQGGNLDGTTRSGIVPGWQRRKSSLRHAHAANSNDSVDASAPEGTTRGTNSSRQACACGRKRTQPGANTQLVGCWFSIHHLRLTAQAWHTRTSPTACLKWA